MSNLPIFVQLAQLENKYLLEKVSFSEYKALKWEIMEQAVTEGESIDPLYKGKKEREIADSRGTYFCYVPPSSFVFGADLRYSELNAGIYMAKYPVTVRDFTEFLDATGWDYSAEDRERLAMVSPEPDCPVSNVSWNDAKQYCRWLRSINNEYYSLPYESEWEYAARGIDGRIYPWGNQATLAQNACYTGPTQYGCTVSVKKFLNNKSPFGCVGCVGNVWEWCLDEFDDPSEPHILRGGAWCHDENHVVCTSRVSLHPPDNRVEYSGFRLVYLPGEMFEEYQASI